MAWSPVKVAILCGGADGRATIEQKVRERGFDTAEATEFLKALASPLRTVFDFETRCDISVVDVGAWKYAFHPSNEVLCVAWTSRPSNSGYPEYVAHNTGFEQAHCLRHIPNFQLIPEQWSCTASRARRLGIPGALEGACNVMRTVHRKSVEGHRVMLQVSQPRPAFTNRGSGAKWFEDAERLATNAVYCAEDIFAERDLDDVLPELPEFERRVWLQVEKGNRRGLRLDVDLIEHMEHLIAGEEDRILSELRQPVELGGTGVPTFSLTAPEQIREFCARCGTHLPDLKKETVEFVLAGHRSGQRPVHYLVAKVLEGRQIVGKSSNAKLPAMRDRLQEDGYARDYAIYHGAHTGRQTGSAVNPLNMPKPYKGYNQEKMVELIRARDREGIEAARSAVTTAVSATLRGTIIAPPGKRLVVGDYSSIEPCVTFTLAGQWDAVEILRNRGDLYCEMASAVFERPITKKDEKERALGKALILGCTYGLGADAFIVRLKMDGLDVPEDLARRAHGVFRTRFPEVKRLWSGLEEAAKSAIREPHARFAYSKISYVFDGYWLVMTLPSGRPFYYPNASLQPGKYQDELCYEGRTRAGSWGTVRTWGGSCVENASQSISRDITMEDKLECERRYGWHVPLDVYDEIVAEADEHDPDALEKLYAVMRRPRAWLPEIPIHAEGYMAHRYRKE